MEFPPNFRTKKCTTSTESKKYHPESKDSGWHLAPPARLELTTLRLGGARSIQVSYGGMLEYYSGKIGRCQGLKKRKIPLYRIDFIRYNKLICYGHNTFLMEYLI